MLEDLFGMNCSTIHPQESRLPHPSSTFCMYTVLISRRPFSLCAPSLDLP